MEVEEDELVAFFGNHSFDSNGEGEVDSENDDSSSGDGDSAPDRSASSSGEASDGIDDEDDGVDSDEEPRRKAPRDQRSDRSAYQSRRRERGQTTGGAEEGLEQSSEFGVDEVRALYERGAAAIGAPVAALQQAASDDDFDSEEDEPSDDQVPSTSRRAAVDTDLDSLAVSRAAAEQAEQRRRQKRAEIFGVDVDDMYAEVDKQAKTTGRVSEYRKQKRRRENLRQMNPELQYLLGRANECFVERRFSDAINHLKEVIRAAPHFAEPYITLASVWEELGDLENASACRAVAAIARPHRLDLWKAAGTSAFDCRHYRNAAIFLRKVVGKYKNDFSLRMMLAESMLRSGATGAAVMRHLEVLTQEGSLSSAQVLHCKALLLECLMQTGEFERAAEFARSNLAPLNENSLPSVVDALALFYARIGNIEDGLLLEPQANALDIHVSATAYCSLTDMAIQSNQISLAAEYAQRCFALVEGRDVDILHRLATMLFAAGLWDLAAKTYEKCVCDSRFNDAPSWTNYALCLLASGRSNEAERVLNGVIDEVGAHAQAAATLCDIQAAKKATEDVHNTLKRFWGSSLSCHKTGVQRSSSGEVKHIATASLGEVQQVEELIRLVFHACAVDAHQCVIDIGGCLIGALLGSGCGFPVSTVLCSADPIGTPGVRIGFSVICGQMVPRTDIRNRMVQEHPLCQASTSLAIHIAQSVEVLYGESTALRVLANIEEAAARASVGVMAQAARNAMRMAKLPVQQMREHLESVCDPQDLKEFVCRAFLRGSANQAPDHAEVLDMPRALDIVKRCNYISLFVDICGTRRGAVTRKVAEQAIQELTRSRVAAHPLARATLAAVLEACGAHDAAIASYECLIDDRETPEALRAICGWNEAHALLHTTERPEIAREVLARSLTF